MKYMNLISLSIFIGLTGCLSPQQIEAEKQQYCANMGAPLGAEHYYECRQNLENRFNAAQQARIQNQQPMHVDYTPIITPRLPQRNCVSNINGNIVYTNCY